ncbi:SRPBCC family protein [Variovorax sp. H27-G14]|uniref:SRPBCC family protein n=1 Tax=Variovorax sp. H27-G14 TaxID=3111914 RepID=UPI0038FD18EF
MATNTIRLHRVLRTTPDRLYRAFVEAAAFERWLPPFGFTGKVDTMEPVVGGAWHMSFTNFGTGHSHSFGGKYLALVPGQRIAYDARFDDVHLPGTMTTTVTLTAVSCGTEMSVVQEGIPDMIPTEMCYLGWQESLVALAQLVEPNIPG